MQKRREMNTRCCICGSSISLSGYHLRLRLGALGGLGGCLEIRRNSEDPLRKCRFRIGRACTVDRLLLQITLLAVKGYDLAGDGRQSDPWGVRLLQKCRRAIDFGEKASRLAASSSRGRLWALKPPGRRRLSGTPIACFCTARTAAEHLPGRQLVV
jgi:hypothetical protein